MHLLFANAPVRTKYLSLLLGAACLLRPALAHAHANTRWPNVVALAGQAPGAAGGAAPWLVGLTFGAMVSDDQGRRFDWICEDALLGPSANDPFVAVLSATDFVFADPSLGLTASHDGGCSWQRVAAFAPPFAISDLAHAGPGGPVYVLGTRAGAERAELWQSSDGARTFVQQPLAEPCAAPSDLASTPHAALPLPPITWTAVTASAAPDAHGGLWLAGSSKWPGRSAFVARYAPAARCLVASAVAGAPAISGQARIAAHPREANTVLVGFLDVATNGTELLKTTDGGRHFAQAALVREPLRAIVFGGGEHVWVAGTSRTLHSADRGNTYVRLQAPKANACAAHLAGHTYVCGDAALGDGFSLGEVSADASQVVHPFVMSSLLGPYRCAEHSQVRTTCMGPWRAQAQALGAHYALPKKALVAK